MQHIRAWRRSSDVEAGGSPKDNRGTGSASTSSFALPSAPEVVVGASKLTETFANLRRLDFHEKIEDGFRDTLPKKAQRGKAAVDAEVVVDRHDDPTLAEFVDRAGKKLLRTEDVVSRVMVTSLLVSEAFGRSGDHAADLHKRCERLLMERADPDTGTIKLGHLMQTPREPGAGDNSKREPGAGTARHRALLFKAASDWLAIASCALCRTGELAESWNVVLVEGEPFVVDVIFDPGALYEQDSGRAAEYLKRLSGVAEIAAAPATPAGAGRRNYGGGVAGGTLAPSVQQHLEGRMVRPSWHVEPWEVEFDRRDRAGRGGFGEVFQGYWAGEAVAVKEVRDGSPTDGDICDFILEISLLARLSHPNIVRFWRACVDLRGSRRTLLLVTEWMDRGVLSTYLHESQEPNLTAGQSLALGFCIGRGVEYLHIVKILHLDLKSPNVLLDSSWNTKLCDFGLAKLREQTALHTTLRGVSPIWAPPELFDDRASNGGITEKADVYSFGIIMFELMARKLPFSHVSQMQMPRVKQRGELPKFPETINGNVVELMKLCLAHRPVNRPAMSSVLERMLKVAHQLGINPQEEHAQMQNQGLTFGGGRGSATSSVDQLRRAEAEKKRAEAELARLRGLLQEREHKVRQLEERVERRRKRREAGGDVAGAEEFDEEQRQWRLQLFCQNNTHPVSGSKFRCAVCRKMFRGPEFVHKHLREKHLDEMVASLGLFDNAAAAANAMDALAPNPAKVSIAVSHSSFGVGSDQFFDADVAEESNLRLYTGKIAGGTQTRGPAAAPSIFSVVLQDASEAGDVSRVQQCLLQGGATVNQADVDGTTPLQLAAKNGHVDCIRYFLSNAVDVKHSNEAGLTALHLSAQEGHSDACQMLLEAGAVVDAHSSTKAKTPLHVAAANGHRDVCTLLLLHRASVNLSDSDGESPLHQAARFGDRELCEAILSWGADVSAKDNDGWSPLHEAARWGDGGLVQILLERGADPHARSNDGETPLHVVPGGYAEMEVVEVLLLWRCDADCRDYDGESALHVAVKLGDVELAGALLSFGADANVANHAGATPLDFAKRDEIRWLLRSHRGRKGSGAP